MSKNLWQTSKRKIDCAAKTLVMAILNCTPDSFSDGGESTRPQAAQISAETETRRVIPVIEAIAKKFDVPVSVDTSKASVAERATDAGAEIINDISGLRFDERIAEVAARANSGLVLMHLRGEFELMHRQKPSGNVLQQVSDGFRWSIKKAASYGVGNERIALDVGIGFSKTFDQNLELIANLDLLQQEFARFPMLVGASRKSFIGKILDDAPADKRLHGSLASAAIAAWNGANIVRVHDVRATVEMLKVVDKIKGEL